MGYLKSLEQRWNGWLNQPSINMESYEGFIITVLLMALLVSIIIFAVNPGWGS